MDKIEQPSAKKKRRGYFRYIQRCLEFYLSDANLRRDKFIKSKLNDKLEIDCKTVMSFKKLLEMNVTLEDIKIALKPSLTVEVEGEVIKRKLGIVKKTKDEVDSCCLYVERLPPDATIELLQKVFSAFGKVAMVTLPKYKTNKKIKGFGFIEFENESACNVALKKFSTCGGLLYPNEEISSCKKCLGQSEREVEAEDPVPEQETAEKPVPPITADPVKPESEAKPVEASQEDLAPTRKRKKNRQRKKWQRNMVHGYLGMQIMPKLKWNQLRERYLSLQAANRRLMKLQLAKLRRAALLPPPRTRTQTPGSVVTITGTKPVTDSELRYLRTHLRQVIAAEYIDIECGQTTGYVRLGAAEDATWLVSHSAELLPNYSIELLPPAAQDLYWIKIDHDRQNKMKKEKKAKKKNISGSRKILMRAEKQLGVKIKLSPDSALHI